MKNDKMKCLKKDLVEKERKKALCKWRRLNLFIINDEYHWFVYLILPSKKY